MANFTWNNCAVPHNLKIKQVYGVVFSDDKRIILRVENDKYKLTGGKPEENESYEETLKREYIEELNIELEDIYYLGYLLVEENGIEPYAQVRMIGKIKRINTSCPDIDTRKQYKRFFSSINNVKKYLNYKDKAGNLFIDDAIIMANKKYQFEKISDIENFV
ncbi:MAG: NUDIX domain-containing protein [Bacilli bacterium]|nr:NUDIX domain-containing protein [Bacilli bacterium]